MQIMKHLVADIILCLLAILPYLCQRGQLANSAVDNTNVEYTRRHVVMRLTDQGNHQIYRGS